MTMHIYFEQDKDGYKKGQSCHVERSLARRFCRNGIAIPYQKHLDNIYDAEQAEKKEVERLLAEKEKAKKEKAVSKKPKKAEKSVKK